MTNWSIKLIQNFLIFIVALLHVYFLFLEMFMWTKPLGLKVFRMTPEQAQQSAVLAANQGLYNGFLAVGLLWSILADVDISDRLAVFFLSCVIVAALYGGYSVSKKILFVQGLPAVFALATVLLFS